MSIRIRNPHSVLAALETRPKSVSEILMPPGFESGTGDTWGEVLKLAREHKVRISGRPRPQGPVKPDDGGRLGSAEAVAEERGGISTEELFANARERAEGKGLWLALDSLQDPHNVGAIFRAAAFFGVQGIMITQERSAPITSTVYDVASGGVEYVPFTLQTNLQRGFEVAKEAGLWILGASEHAKDDVQSIHHDRPWLLVLGNEEKGMRRLTEESCDVLCKVGARGKVTSLNVSVAAGVLISALTRS